MMEEKNQIQHGEEKELNPIEELEEIIQKRLKQKTEKAKVWRDVFTQFRDWILQSLEKGVSKADIHYALNEYVKKKYGKQYLIKANYFYTLFKEYFGNTETTKNNLKKPSKTISENHKDNSPNQSEDKVETQNDQQNQTEDKVDPQNSQSEDKTETQNNQPNYLTDFLL